MTIWQETSIPAISLPNGSRSFPKETIQILQKFERVIIAVDDDGAGLECRKRLSEKLDIKKCAYVTWKAGNHESLIKDANDALLNNQPILNLVMNPIQFDHQSINTIESYRETVYANLLDPNVYEGVPLTCMPKLTKLIGGLRMGELTVLSGPTGVGKTAIAAQHSIDWATQGVATLWGSFEIPNEDLITRMLKTIGKKDLQNDISNFTNTFDKLAQLPLWLMKFHAATKMEDVMDAIDYAVSVYDVRHIIIDNLQFMIGSIIGQEKFDIQNKVIDALRDFKKERNIHVTLLAHPRKYDLGKEMTENDLFGSAKLSQDADNVYVIDPTGDYMRFTVRKCRKLGALVSGAGTNKRKCVHYRFDKASESAIEVDIDHMRRLDEMEKREKYKQLQAN
jgi:twinkle protein